MPPMAPSAIDSTSTDTTTELVSNCAGRLKLVALIQDGAVIQRILRHLGLPDVVPGMHPSRAPPLPFDSYDDRVSGDDY